MTRLLGQNDVHGWATDIKTTKLLRNGFQDRLMRDRRTRVTVSNPLRVYVCVCVCVSVCLSSRGLEALCDVFLTDRPPA